MAATGTRNEPGDNLGKVYLVGAGPGDPGLITLRAVECLGRADLVLYDYLVNPAILHHAPPSAEVVCLGHHRLGRVIPQHEVNARMIDAARRHKTVVRLKGGDPAIFAHSAEETAALRAAGVRWEVVPGVTAALALPGYAGTPAVALVTGQQRHDKGVSGLDYRALADFPGTLVFYMGVTSVKRWSQALIGGGKSPEAPVTVVRRCSWPDQLTVRCTLGTVAAVVTERKLRPPAVIVVGQFGEVASTARPIAGGDRR